MLYDNKVDKSILEVIKQVIKYTTIIQLLYSIIQNIW